jgi:hypothetical protein
MDNNGNTASALVNVTIEDHIPPVVRNKNITIKLDERGIAAITPEDINNGSIDNCAIKSMKINREEFTREQRGDHEVELTVFDTSGNISTGEAIVTVISE